MATPTFWTIICFWMALALGHCALLATFSWRLSRRGTTCLSMSFWFTVLEEAVIYLLILAQLVGGVLTKNDEPDDRTQKPCTSGHFFSFGLVLLTLASVALVLVLVTEAQVQVDRKRLFRRLSRRRPGCWRNFAAGLLLGASAYGASEGVQFFVERNLNAMSLFLLLSSQLGGLWVRGAAVQGTCALPVLFLCRDIYTRWCLGLARGITNHLPCVVMLLLGSTAETSRDKRAWQLLSYVCSIASWIGAHHVVLGYRSKHLLILGCFVFGHFLKIYSRRGRKMRTWSDAIAMLKFNEIRRRREEDRNFVLERRQDMDEDIFGSPLFAKYIIVVSHAWLSPDHADPDGLHLDIVISSIKEKLRPPCWHWFWLWWWRYYVLEAEGDVLLFFDMSSLAQMPRTKQEEANFKRALKLMNFLYFSFDVLVIPDIPASVKFHGKHVTYLEKGWCSAEVTIAMLGGQLQRFSPVIMAQLDEEMELWDQHGMSLADSLLGLPPYPAELMLRGREQSLMAFRRMQRVKGKVFTNGKFDADRVSRMLSRMELQQKLREHLLADDTREVMEIFAKATNFPGETQSERGGLTREELASTVFDATFTTPLHLAVAAGSEELVKFLVLSKARPQRNAAGYLPWERFAFRPLFSAAARAAREPVSTLPPVCMADSLSSTRSSMEMGGTVTGSHSVYPLQSVNPR